MSECGMATHHHHDIFPNYRDVSRHTVTRGLAVPGPEQLHPCVYRGTTVDVVCRRKGSLRDCVMEVSGWPVAEYEQSGDGRVYRAATSHRPQ